MSDTPGDNYEQIGTMVGRYNEASNKTVLSPVVYEGLELPLGTGLYRKHPAPNAAVPAVPTSPTTVVSIGGRCADHMSAKPCAFCGQEVPWAVKQAAEFTRQDLGETGKNYPYVRALLGFVEECIKRTSK